MKTLILSAAIIFALSFGANATIADPVNQKVMKTFNMLFEDADNVSWTNAGDNYEAYFTSDNVKTRALLDAKGHLVQTVRYYKENELPANILYNLKKDYKGQEVWGITEVSNSYGVHYRIVLRNDKSYTHLNVNAAGESELVKKFKRGDK